jgi:hypothetical protein
MDQPQASAPAPAKEVPSSFSALQVAAKQFGIADRQKKAEPRTPDELLVALKWRAGKLPESWAHKLLAHYRSGFAPLPDAQKRV